MKTQRIRNSTKRGLVYLSVALLYVSVFSNILLNDKPADNFQSSLTASRVSG